MNYWWVSQNKTFKEEQNNNFMWSPKTKSNGHKNQHYSYMKECSPGDIVLSFNKGVIANYGIVQARAETHSKPTFKNKDNNWNQEGWLVAVSWHPLKKEVRPSELITELKPHLPSKYSPLKKDGSGQEAYLSKINIEIINIILKNAGMSIKELYTPTLEAELDSAESLVLNQIINNTEIEKTEKEQLIKSRIGQGRFKSNLIQIENECRFTGIKEQCLLIASHIKPWAKCATNKERLDGNNGLLLTPTFDLLFDKGLITFNDTGEVIVSDSLSKEIRQKIGLDKTTNVGTFNKEQSIYLEYHRINVFKGGIDELHSI